MSGTSARPVIFGEVLFDCFEDGGRVLGGAPFNVAWHLAGFGLAPLFVSRVGADELGERVLAAMAEWGLDVTGVQRDPLHPTGSVQVTLSGGQPEYRILPDQAYDYIDVDAASAALGGGRPALVYHGSLGTRNRVSRKTLEGLRASGAPAFVDINLRTPWWNRPGVDGLLRGARWVKLSDEELVVLAGPGTAESAGLEAAARALRARYGCELLIVTQGDEGGVFVTADGGGRIAPAAVAELVDSVGAGDAFSAVTILGLLRGWDLPETFGRAAQFAAYVCGLRGATTHDRRFYEEPLREWAAV